MAGEPYTAASIFENGGNPATDVMLADVTEFKTHRQPIVENDPVVVSIFIDLLRQEGQTERWPGFPGHVDGLTAIVANGTKNIVALIAGSGDIYFDTDTLIAQTERLARAKAEAASIKDRKIEESLLVKGNLSREFFGRGLNISRRRYNSQAGYSDTETFPNDTNGGDKNFQCFVAYNPGRNVEETVRYTKNFEPQIAKLQRFLEDKKVPEADFVAPDADTTVLTKGLKEGESYQLLNALDCISISSKQYNVGVFTYNDDDRYVYDAAIDRTTGKLLFLSKRSNKNAVYIDKEVLEKLSVTREISDLPPELKARLGLTEEKKKAAAQALEVVTELPPDIKRVSEATPEPAAAEPAVSDSSAKAGKINRGASAAVAAIAGLTGLKAIAGGGNKQDGAEEKPKSSFIFRLVSGVALGAVTVVAASHAYTGGRWQASVGKEGIGKFASYVTNFAGWTR